MPDSAPPVLQELLCQLAKQSRGDTVVKSWAQKHGSSGSVRERVQALLDALVPLEQRIDSASKTLMHPAWMFTHNVRGDVDDVAVAVGAACESLGIETKIGLVTKQHADFAYYTVHLHVKDENGDWLTYALDSLSPVL